MRKGGGPLKGVGQITEEVFEVLLESRKRRWGRSTGCLKKRGSYIERVRRQPIAGRWLAAKNGHIFQLGIEKPTKKDVGKR